MDRILGFAGLRVGAKLGAFWNHR